jgi:hypothetical protein
MSSISWRFHLGYAEALTGARSGSSAKWTLESLEILEISGNSRQVFGTSDCAEGAVNCFYRTSYLTFASRHARHCSAKLFLQ